MKMRFLTESVVIGDVMVAPKEIFDAYDIAEKNGMLQESTLALALAGERPLAILPLEDLNDLRKRLHDAEQKLDERKTVESIAWFSSQGLDQQLLSPEDVPAASPVAGSKTAVAVMASAVRAANTTYETIHKATKRAATEIAESQRIAATNTMGLIGHRISAARPGAIIQTGSLRHKRKNIQGS